VTGQVRLDISCLDRVYLTGFWPGRRPRAGLIYFLRDHRASRSPPDPVRAHQGEVPSRDEGLGAGQRRPGDRFQGQWAQGWGDGPVPGNRRGRGPGL